MVDIIHIGLGLLILIALGVSIIALIMAYISINNIEELEPIKGPTGNKGSVGDRGSSGPTGPPADNIINYYPYTGWKNINQGEFVPFLPGMFYNTDTIFTVNVDTDYLIPGDTITIKVIIGVAIEIPFTGRNGNGTYNVCFLGNINETNQVVRLTPLSTHTFIYTGLQCGSNGIYLQYYRE